MTGDQQREDVTATESDAFPGPDDDRPSPTPPRCPSCGDVHWGSDEFRYACPHPFHQTGEGES